ncbi:P-loop containing nucleoside triphosphate hydrolase [Freshwater phage uvFW-CGR-AMD-COM-C440]|nr:P-loop containing nucleoside triphosphate hydrolase [Freshwater phage uvFW-CGR-AMD-COM-C440]
MLIGLSGYARSGKDTVAELLCLNYGYKRVSFADPMRQALYVLSPKIDNIVRLSEYVDDYGWDVAKQNQEVRRLLQVFGTEVGRKMFGLDFWIDIALKDLSGDTQVVISDVRFPNEADAIAKLGGSVWRINRKNHSAVNGHASEHAMDNYMFNHVIYNDGTLDDLSDEVFMLAKHLGLDK